ncbi:hypothetical protein EOS93_12555 [Rhizobium sp. RMa-01]|uniref:hypothetical protein n=1 Tax=unclassified Rhizobium TaxID=2613769 RepID=UPI0008D9D398|nr:MULTISPECIES: hypothetical protein [unclassified Rhizobium]OHV19963.1 hypothetical protein BBJ66_13955 [Rhizobium sp. RSm-3]RVU10875.1 hypothetical protein EOS93_12555 [Rhizobium sp. RMa-01]
MSDPVPKTSKRFALFRNNSLLAFLSIFLCIMTYATAAAAAGKETLQIPKIFRAMKLQNCNQYHDEERLRCEATILNLGYFSWGLVFAARGFDLAPRIMSGDLNAFQDFVKDDPVYMTQKSAVVAFLNKPFKICAYKNCGKFLGLSEPELAAVSAEFDESRRSMLCLLKRDRSKDKPGGALSDRTLLTDVESMQRGLIPGCEPKSTAIEETIRRAFRN